MFTKANTDILAEAFRNPTVNGKKGRKLLVSFIGAVEIVIGQDEDGYVTNLYNAIQLPTGEILGVDENNNAFSLSKELFQIHWGYYPINFPEKQKTTRKAPKAFAPWDHIQVNTSGITTIDDLPF